MCRVDAERCFGNCHRGSEANRPAGSTKAELKVFTKPNSVSKYYMIAAIEGDFEFAFHLDRFELPFGFFRL